MDYVLKPSLEQMTLTRIAIALWDQDDVRAPMKEHLLPSNIYNYSHRREKRLKPWLEAGEKVIEKVPGLLLPEPLKKKLLKFISGIGCEMFKWVEHHYDKFKLPIFLPSDLCWTPHGTVDTKKTAEAIVQNANIDVTCRYRLACDYCLDDLLKLWDKIPKNVREEFDYEMEGEFLVAFWTCRIKGEVDKLDDEIKRKWRSKASHFRYAFVKAARNGNKTAAEFCLQELTDEERKVSLVTCARLLAYECKGSSYFPDVLCFLLSQIDQLEQTEVFKECPDNVLRCLLEWPWQSFFIETANRMWDFLSRWDFRFLLTEILLRVRKGYKDCDYQKLFGKFWQQSPDAHKKYVIEKLKTEEPFLLSDLFAIEDEENVRLILNSATVEEKRDIIFSPGGNRICEHLVATNKWDSIKLFLQECPSTKEVMSEFKEKFKEHAHEIQEARCKVDGLLEKMAAEEHKSDKYCQLLHDLNRT